jgi:uncharacterized protein (TIGR02270 family)
MSSNEAKAPAPPRFFDHIVEATVEDADFLWTRWERFLDAPDLGFEQVYFWVEQRLQGALDGLRGALEGGMIATLEEALASDSPGAISAAAHALASSRSPAGLELLTRAFTSFEDAALHAIRRGIEVSDGGALFAELGRAARASSPACCAAWLDLHAQRELDPGPPLADLLGSPDPQLRAAAARAARCAPALAEGPLLRLLDDGELSVVVAGIEAGLTRRQSAAWETCLSLCGQSRPPAACAPLLNLLAMSNGQRAERMLIHALEIDELARDAVFALGISGRVWAAEQCLELLRQGRLVKTAAESFCAITGLQLAAAKLVAPEPEGEAADQAPVPSIDDGLPNPDPSGIARWWQQNSARFSADGRYAHGRPLELSALNLALQEGPARWRHERARELRLRSAGAARLMTRGFARTQRAQLAELAALTVRQLVRIEGWSSLH